MPSTPPVRSVNHCDAIAPEVLGNIVAKRLHAEIVEQGRMDGFGHNRVDSLDDWTPKSVCLERLAVLVELLLVQL